jgi:PleD family two-component response regulator
VFYCVTENNPVELSRAFAGGAHDYILKPFDRAVLEEKLAGAGFI